MPQRTFPMAVTGELAERYAAWVDAPDAGARAKLAATVMLVRDGAAGVEVFVQRRVASMAFAARRVVFPGGSVDPGDHGPLPWAGPSLADWAGVLDAPVEVANALVSAAIRELFEEAGVLLAGPDGHAVLGAASEDVRLARQRVLARQAGLGAIFGELGLVARTDLLGYAAHWITPEVEPRRYDTHFFTALLPPAQEADGGTTEAESAEWARPADLLSDADDVLMPPTRVCLEMLASADSAAEIVARRAPVPAVKPRPVPHAGGWGMQADLP